MSPPAPQINTFMKVSDIPVIDSISKTFIIAQLLLGTNRLPLLGITKKMYYLSICGFSFIFYIILIWSYIEVWLFNNLIYIMMIGDLLRYLICNILALLLNTRLTKFYDELKKINKDIGFEIKNSRSPIFILNYSFMVITKLCYYGQLFIIVIPSVRALRNLMELSYPYKKGRDQLNTHNTGEGLHHLKHNIKQQSTLDMAQIMKLYQKVLRMHNILYESIKWQMLACIVLSFTCLLVLFYKIMTFVIIFKYHFELWLNLAVTLIEIIPLWTPCIFADQLSREVCQLKDVLASKLYDNTLDKSNRGAARAMLTLMKTHDLSFTLFHMFDIDLSFPIKFCALLFTYVVIMMQFNKVLNQSI